MVSIEGNHTIQSKELTLYKQAHHHPGTSHTLRRTLLKSRAKKTGLGSDPPLLHKPEG